MVTSGQRAGGLLSVNVGMPQDVAWHGRNVHTAVWKQPVTGPRMARRLNIDGDGQGDLAGHGGEHRAVFVYQIGSYRYWQDQLGRDDFEFGQFGENFAVQAGDEIVKLATGPAAMTVAEIDALLYLPGHPRQQVLRALRIPALSGGWKTSFQEILDQPAERDGAGNAGLTAASPPPAWPGFRPLTVTAIGQDSDTVRS